MRPAVAIARRLLHAEHVVGKHFPGETLEHRFTGADDVVQRAAGAAREIAKAPHLQVPVFGDRRPQDADPSVVPGHVHHQHVDRDTRKRSGANDGLQIAGAVQHKAFRQQDERFRTLDRG